MQREMFKGKVIYRSASLADVPAIYELDKEVWGSEGADSDMLMSRIGTFPQGNVLLLINGKVVGYMAFQYVEDLREKEVFTWSEITDNGFIARSHTPEGWFSYGVNLSVHKSVQGFDLGNTLLMFGIADMIEHNKRGAFLGSRIPGYRRFHKKNPGVSAEEYIHLKSRGRARDSELRLYEKEGFVVEKLLPGYFPDPESLDFGALIQLPNPYLDDPQRREIAEGMRDNACEMTEQSLSHLKEL